MSDQSSMFGDTHEDLPLFSGTPIHVKPQAFEPNASQVEQSRMATCGICLDTGWVKADPKKKPVICNCAAGDAVRVKRKEMGIRDVLGALPESKALVRIRQNAAGAYADENEAKDGIERLIRETTGADLTQLEHAPHVDDLTILQVVLGVPDNLVPMQLIQRYGSIYGIVRAPNTDLLGTKSMTPRRVYQLRAAMELARRAREFVSGDEAIIRAPGDAAQLLDDMHLLDHEQMRVLCLNTKNRVIRVHQAYQGSLHTTVIRVSELFAEPIRIAAAAVIIAHNHPSGDPSPSPEDVAVTREIVNAGKLLDIDVLDHLVLGGNKFVSLKERGLGFG
ncbi:MAG: DNA repair protein RadC [Chloroflexi bacterium]|nr:DNA repair protein RadC [Chloroflexota bacterium]